MRKSIRNILKNFMPVWVKAFICESNRALPSAEVEKQKDIGIPQNQEDDAAKKLVPRRTINFAVPLVEHCNLKCHGCDHFAPIANEGFAGIDEFEKDFTRLSQLLGGEAVKIGLMGGEPLLHPQIKEFLPIARRSFPEVRIRIVSNGLLLLKQKDDFWDACRENDIAIEITKYPINLRFDRMQEVADRFGVAIRFYDNTGETQKTSHHAPLDLEGRQDAHGNFLKCFHANATIFLKEGRLYTCTVAPNIEHFNKYFKTNLPALDEDSIDIYKAITAQEIYNFLCKPIPFCRYCYVDKRTYGNPWKRSRQDIKEWTV